MIKQEIDLKQEKTFEIRSKIFSSSAEITVTVENEKGDVSDKTEIVLREPDGKEQTSFIEKDENSVTFIIERPFLWMSSEKKKQPLYEVTVNAIEDGNVISSVTKKTGLCKIRSFKDKDGTCLRLNSAPFFIRGVYFSSSALLTDNEELSSVFSACKKSGLNTFYITDGLSDKEEFYNFCDETGFFVLSDNKSNITKDLLNHPCLSLLKEDKLPEKIFIENKPSAKESYYSYQVNLLEKTKKESDTLRIKGDAEKRALFYAFEDCFYKKEKYLPAPLIKSLKGLFEEIRVCAFGRKGKADIYITNDSAETFKGKLICFCAPFDAKEYVIFEKEIEVSPRSVSKITTLKSGNKRKEMLLMRLYDEEKYLVGEERTSYCKNNKLKLLKSEIKIETTVKNGNFYVSVGSDKYARYVYLETESKADFSENFFDLSPYGQKNLIAENLCVTDEIKAVSYFFVKKI